MSRKAWILSWILQDLKNYARKTCDCGQPEGLLIRVLNRKEPVSDGGNLCLLWSVILKSVWNGVGGTFELRYSWPWAVVRCTLLAAVPLDWNIRIGEQGHVFPLSTDFKRRFWCFIPDINQCIKNIFRLRKVEFIRINLNINSLFIAFVKFEIKRWFSAYQDQFCVWFSLARLQTARVFISEPFSIFLLPARLCFSYQSNASTIPFCTCLCQIM